MKSGNNKKPVDHRHAGKEKQGDPRSRRKLPREVGGPRGPEPTRFGDWEKAGRCIDF